jgi:DNA-directed RNA polymerase subunit M/transcription elongation factor TFIIS
MSDQTETFKDKCLKNLSNMEFDKHSLEKNYISHYKFVMKNSVDITYNLLREAETLLDRNNAVKMLNKYIDNEFISNEIEKGMFEYTLLQVVTKKLLHHYCLQIYETKLYTICSNLDLNDKNIENQTLLPAILSGEIKPYMVSFLSPQQLHPKRWESVIQKRLREDDAMYNIETTDEYECPKCNEKKCTVETIQLRSADEPANKFVVCVVCGYTIIY